MNYGILLLGFFVSSLHAMVPKSSQLEFCPTRKTYYQTTSLDQKKSIQPTSSITPKVCIFCDKTTLSNNYIIYENQEHNVRQMMNKFPYVDFDQGQQILVMPISHKEHPSEFSYKELVYQVDTVQKLSAQLYDEAYTQEYFFNWGEMSGQTVAHLHDQFKNFVKPPMSLPERMESIKNPRIYNIEAAYRELTAILESKKNIVVPSQVEVHNNLECNCCLIKNDQDKDDNNFVIARFEHNYICLSHHPSLPGEISIVPYNHVSAIKDLYPEALHENIMLAKALLPKMKEYAQEYIRECGGGNIYTKSIGNKSSNKEKNEYHVHTRIMPRTKVPLTPGNFDDNSCKLDYDPLHLFEYLKNKKDEFKTIIT